MGDDLRAEVVAGWEVSVRREYSLGVQLLKMLGVLVIAIAAMALVSYFGWQQGR